MRKLMVGLVVLLGLSCGAAGANAAVITVDTTVDNYGFGAPDCSLRNAVSAADQDLPGFGDCPAGSGEDTIRLPGGTYALGLLGAGFDNASGDLNFQGSGDLTIEPTGSDQLVTIDGLYADRILTKTGSGVLTIRNMALVKGQTPLAPDALSYGSEGGAARSNNGILNLDRVLLFDNRSGMNGGALHSGLTGTINVVNSTISSNQAAFSGAAIANADSGSVTVRSSTITLNEADSNNDGSGSAGGILQDSSGSFSMYNTILAGNLDPSAPVITDCRSAPNFFPRYVISTQALGSGECLTGFDPGTNLAPADPQLEGLADNGGQTFTHALPPGSPAIDSGSDGSVPGDACPATDQRGAARFGVCDLGAFEYDPTPSPPVPLPGRPEPSGTVATFDGVNLHIRLKCPARFKPKCVSRVVPLTAKRNGRAMAATKSVTTRSNRWKRVSFRIKPAFRSRIADMTFVDRKQLVVRQKVRSKRVRNKKAKRPAIVFHKYKVRVRT